MQTFKDMSKLVRIYKLDTVVQSFSPKSELVFETTNEELQRLLEELRRVASEFSERERDFSTEKGTIEWLNLIHQLLEVESSIIRIVGEANYPKYDEKTRWFLEFAVDSMIAIIQKVQRWIREQAGLLRKMRREYDSLRLSVTSLLSSLELSLFLIASSMMKVELNESKPEELYRVVGEALSRTKHFR